MGMPVPTRGQHPKIIRPQPSTAAIHILGENKDGRENQDPNIAPAPLGKTAKSAGIKAPSFARRDYARKASNDPKSTRPDQKARRCTDRRIAVQ